MTLHIKTLISELRYKLYIWKKEIMIRLVDWLIREK